MILYNTTFHSLSKQLYKFHVLPVRFPETSILVTAIDSREDVANYSIF